MDFIVSLGYISALFAGALALGTAFRGRRSLARWSFAAGLAILAAESLLSSLCADATIPGEVLYWQNRRLLLLSLVPAPWLLFSLTYSRGNHSEYLARWRIPLLVALCLPLLVAFLSSGDLITSISQSQPEHPWILRFGTHGFLLNLLCLLGSLVILMNVERTFRASVGTMRWRIKFMILGLGILFTVRVYTATQALLFHAVSSSVEALNSGALLLACIMFLRAVSRSGHFDVSVYPSQAFLQGSFTIFLAGAYLVIVGFLARFATIVGGDNAFPLKSFLVLIFLVGLAVLLFSQKFRFHTNRLISRHFHRPQYDYRSVWKAFTEDTLRMVEKTALCEALVKLISEVFQALSVTLWLVDDRKENLQFAASTSLSKSQAAKLNLDPSDMSRVLAALASHPEPLDIDSSKEVWAVLLRRLHPDEFRKGGNRLCAPLLAGKELLGVLTLGDRVGGVSYSYQDFDLLKSVSDQAAANLLNIQLSQQLAQARQLEAFQAMSAFFVHDLKNTASTLSLMLQNLPVHFNDPTFREDAFRGISKTVNHINDLIGRLGILRQELTVQRVEADLNDLVTRVLEGPQSNTMHKTDLVTNLKPLPKLRIDPAQIQNVIANLVLNAREAVGSGGQIRVETSQRNGWAVLAVADNGCGMNPDFVKHSLFRPFQTTKKQGIGIGMFQSRMIVEAHQGRIEVESEPGKGTSFRVLLPLQASAAA
jgi:putative PEP-CTERM system histidine kinase